MARQFFTRFIKTLMMTTPFITMITMVLALWGVIGKTTYIGLEPSPKSQDDAVVAENYLVSGTKANGKEVCPTELKSPKKPVDIDNRATDNKDALPIKIDWEHVV